MATTTSNDGSDEDLTFGERLIDAVKRCGGPVSQVPLSQWFEKEHGIKISGTMINNYKNLDAVPRMDQTRDYAVALGVCVEWLLTGRGPRWPGENTTDAERRLLGMWRRMTPTVKRQAFGQLVTLRLMPDISGEAETSEEVVETLIIDTVGEDGGVYDVTRDDDE